MPTYQYSCTDCGHFFEAVQSFSDDSLTQCPECQGRLRKVFNAVGVVFKGSGFYRNDSRSSSGSSEKGSSDKGSSDKGSTEKASDKSSSDKSTTKTGEKTASASSTSPSSTTSSSGTSS